MDTEVSVVTVTPEMAQKYLTENRYEHQRYVRTSQVKFLAEEMQRGTFKQDTAIEFSRVNGNLWLTDGQHRLSAVVWSKIPQRFVVICRYPRDEETTALDYTRTDQVIVRSIADSYKTLSLETELGLTATQVNALGVAVALIDRKFSTKGTVRMHPDDRLRMMREYNNAYSLYLETIAGSRKELRHRLERGATVSVAIITFRYSAMVYGQEKVEAFWNGMAMDDGLRADDPRKTALRHLVEMGMVGGAGVTSKRVTPAFSSRYLATCFNAHIAGKDLKFAKPDVTTSIVILGSPFNGK